MTVLAFPTTHGKTPQQTAGDVFPQAAGPCPGKPAAPQYQGPAGTERRKGVAGQLASISSSQALQLAPFVLILRVAAAFRIATARLFRGPRLNTRRGRCR